MQLIEGIFLGFIQGATEFLPVSSSGHLVIAQKLIGIEDTGVFFELILHLATSLAVLVYFREKLLRLSRGYLVLIVLGSIPAGIIGVLFRPFLEGLFESVRIVGVALIVTGVMNYFVDGAVARREKVSRLDSIIVGIAQAIAVVPGISRSGATIFTGAFLGIKREQAAEFSFLLSVPVVIGASVVEFYTQPSHIGASFVFYIAGFLSAFIFGFLAISLVMRVLFERRFRVFGFYAIILGIAALALG